MTTTDLAADEEVERALSEFLREMDAFVTSWATAVRRFAAEPIPIRDDRDRPTPEVRRGHHPDAAPQAPPRDPMWDRDLDG